MSSELYLAIGRSTDNLAEKTINDEETSNVDVAEAMGDLKVGFSSSRLLTIADP